jgi:hypothetical protein
MKKMRYIGLFFLILLMQCDNKDDSIICTEQFVYGLNVTVRDVTTNGIITDGVVVIARDGSYEEELMNIDGFDNFIGAGERPGNYIIEVTSANYETFTSELIQVGADECHVIGEVIEIVLQPN